MNRKASAKSRRQALLRREPPADLCESPEGLQTVVDWLHEFSLHPEGEAFDLSKNSALETIPRTWFTKLSSLENIIPPSSFSEYGLRLPQMTKASVLFRQTDPTRFAVERQLRKNLAEGYALLDNGSSPAALNNIQVAAGGENQPEIWRKYFANTNRYAVRPYLEKCLILVLDAVKKPEFMAMSPAQRGSQKHRVEVYWAGIMANKYYLIWLMIHQDHIWNLRLLFHNTKDWEINGHTKARCCARLLSKAIWGMEVMYTLVVNVELPTNKSSLCIDWSTIYPQWYSFMQRNGPVQGEEAFPTTAFPTVVEIKKTDYRRADDGIVPEDGGIGGNLLDMPLPQATRDF